MSTSKVISEFVLLVGSEIFFLRDEHRYKQSPGERVIGV